ncbi:TonB-dependent siderophore receptor [Bradyrhizobium sp. KBS0727]|uniref:TonB-dependent receptor n=1 Tax=unclassified Bradyrhizobium TaxID=2631580 RepID=UPI00110E5024|nr:MULTISPECIES: TonB-dependent receptor [unclassified Bradyrhizobium]QDW38138.1 TonB-dependent siderophore receptor [Bradyrhizobium sp. KBS0725]QDW44742.1 TonB-dependent siderophore receptor [Bradyrhizobium sp. KBS0727]
MNKAKAPRSLRFEAAINSVGQTIENNSGKTVSAVAGLIAVASFSGAEAQQTSLPPVTVDAPVARPKPAASKPSADQVRARTALRRAARRSQPAQVAAVPYPNAGGLAADRNPYADASAPYKVDHVQATGKFPEPLLNTPKTITVLSKEVLADENATTLRQAVLSTAGVTLGTGEGGNAFGDRFFIRGFDARNDVFLDGIRDAGVSVRENFFTEQVEILRGPGSTFAGRGTAGGAINIVTKQATTEKSFYNMDTTLGTDSTKRVVLDVNQVISPTFAVRAAGLFQDATVAGRNNSKDDRDGQFITAKWTPLDSVTVYGNYIHTNLHGMPDFGVPYFRPGGTGSSTQQFTSTAGGPYTDFGVNRNTFYGLVFRDYYSIKQDIGTVGGEIMITPDLTLSNKTRYQRSVQDYIGTLPEQPNTLTGLLNLNPQSRYQVTENTANQTELTYKFNTFGWKHTALAGVEVSREISSIDRYTGLSSEALGNQGAPSGTITGASIFYPQYTYFQPTSSPQWTGLPTRVAIDTQSVYAMDSANYNDKIILNGGVRYDNYDVKATGFGTASGQLSPNLWNAQEVRSGMPNFNLGLTLKPMPIGSVYVAYATSTNPVGSEFDGTSAQYGGLAGFLAGNPNQVFGPEKNKAIEVGTKWELFDRHMLVTAALFQTEKDNARESQNVTTAAQAAAIPGCAYTLVSPAPESCISAGAAYRIRGIDLGMGGKITDRWSMMAGLVLMQSEVTNSQLRVTPQPLLYASNVGLPLANVAHQSFSLLTKYQLNDVWELGGQAVYRSKIYGGTFLAANQGTSLPSYWRFDAFAEAKLDKNWTAKLFVANLTNKLYYDALYQSAAPFVLVAPGRSVSMVISARY